MTHRIPSASTSVGEVGIDGIDHQDRGDRRIETGNPHDRCFVAEFGEHPVGGALQRCAADDRRHRDGAIATLGEQFVDAGQRSDRSDRDNRVRGCDDDGGGRFERPREQRRRAAAAPSKRIDVTGTEWRRRTK